MAACGSVGNVYGSVCIILEPGRSFFAPVDGRVPAGRRIGNSPLMCWCRSTIFRSASIAALNSVVRPGTFRRRSEFPCDHG